MITKADIISVLMNRGLSVIESDKTLDSVDNFTAALVDIEEKAVREYIEIERGKP